MPENDSTVTYDPDRIDCDTVGADVRRHAFERVREALAYATDYDAMHKAVQKVLLAKGDVKSALDEAAAEVDRATAAYKKG